MEVGNSKHHTELRSFGRSAYAPTRDSSAYAYESAVQLHPKKKKGAIDVKPQAGVYLRPASKAALIISMMIFSGALLAVIFRYYSITREYREVNKLDANIKETRLRISELNIELECAVNIQDAREAALSLGMTYPQSKQYVKVGDALSIPGGRGEADDGGAVGDDTGDGEPDDNEARGNLPEG